MKAEAVIFDLDDTLTKTWVIKWQHHKAVAKRFYGIDLTDDTLALHWGKPFDEMIGLLYQHADTVENMRIANRSIEAEFLKEVQPHAVATIAELSAAGVPLALLTSTNEAFAIEDLRRAGFTLGDFIVIQGAEATTAHKPDPAVFIPVLKMLRGMGIDQNIVYVGDALIDYYAARDAGLGFVGVTTGRTSAHDFRRSGATVLIDNIAQLSIVLDVPRATHTPIYKERKRRAVRS